MARAAKWVLGLDIGTQSLKAIVTDGELRIAGAGSESYGVSYPAPGWAEQDPQLWERALSGSIAQALSKAQVKPGEISAIGVAGQLDGCVAVGRDGAPVGPCLIWIDRRAQEQVASVDAESLRRKTGVVADASHMAAKIAWLKKNGATGARCFHQPVSYLVSRLTGRHVFDHGLASTTMLYSLEQRDYDPELLRAFSISREELPEIADAEAIAGRLTELGSRLCGLPAGIPVAVGTGDDFSSPLGAGLAEPGRMAVVLGTAEVVGALDSKLKIDEHGLLETHRYAGDRFFIENPGWLSGGALTWFKNTFRLERVEEIDELAAQVPAGADGLVFLPALSGAMAPEWIASARGCFYGLTPAHGLGHLARALLEGCAFAMCDVLERLREMQVPIESILLSGGGANSRLWAQIRADVSGLPVVIPAFKDTSPLGAAMLAAVAGGLQPNVAACATLLERTSTAESFTPSQVPAYQQAYSRYRLLFESLKPMYKEHS